MTSWDLSTERRVMQIMSVCDREQEKRASWSSNIQYGWIALLLIIACGIAPKLSYGQQGESRQVDILFLFDDTVSFEPFIEAFSGLAQTLIEELESSMPEADFGFGIARFEDYGGPGWSFCSGPRTCLEDRSYRINGRPFILNQAIVTREAAGGAVQRNQLLTDALSRTAPGFGGDDPESALADALYQAATGNGFDGDGDGILTGFSGTQRAGELDTQMNPDESGDVPPFSTLSESHPRAGSQGGVGFRSDAVKLIVLATDICSVVAIPAGADIPEYIVGLYSNELLSDFRCSAASFGEHRVGYVSDAYSGSMSTIEQSVVPRGSADIQLTINALNASDIRVIGMGPSVRPMSQSSGASFEPSHFLSALARITGAVDSLGTPLVFDIADGPNNVREKLIESVLLATASENPGCQQVQLESQYTSLELLLRRQQRNLNRVLRLLRREQIVSASTEQRAKRRGDNMLQKGLAVVKLLPTEPFICASLACPAISQLEHVLQLRDTARFFKRRVSRLSRSSGQMLPMETSARMARKRKRARVLNQKIDELIELLPVSTNACEAAS